MITIEDFIVFDDDDAEDLLIPPQTVVESRCRRTLLGYIEHTRLDGFLPRWNPQQPSTRFLPTSQEGQQLVEGNRGLFDPSLGFLGCPVDVLASSNGFLLCRPNPNEHMYGSAINEPLNMDYIVCNPVTRQFRRLPKAIRPYFLAPVAFICRGDCVTSLDEIEFEVVKAGVPKASELVSVLIETFSSRTNTWQETLVASDLPFHLRCHVLFGPIVIGELIFWSTHTSSLLAYDRRKGVSAQLIQQPPRWDGQEFLCDTDLHGISEGKLHYARYGHGCLELWVLEVGKDDGGSGGYGWVLKHRVTSSEIPIADSDTIEAFHPQNSDFILVTLCFTPHWLDLRSKQKKLIRCGFISPRVSFFPYEWPAPVISEKGIKN